jgi:hypothetical protein
MPIHVVFEFLVVKWSASGHQHGSASSRSRCDMASQCTRLRGAAISDRQTYNDTLYFYPTNLRSDFKVDSANLRAEAFPSPSCASLAIRVREQLNSELCLAKVETNR